MNHILFLLNFYLPNADPNGFCCSHVAEELARQGYHVMVAALRQSDTDVVEMINGVEVLRVHQSWPAKKRNRAVNAFLTYSKWLWPWFRYPFTTDWKKVSSMTACTEKIIEENHIDTLICVCFPIETLLTAASLKRKFPNLRCYGYLLDSYSAGFCPRILPQSFTRNRKKKWEARLLEPMDGTLLMDTARDYYEKNCQNMSWYGKARYCDIPAMVPPDRQPVTAGNRETVTICFTGTMQKHVRTPDFFLELLERVTGIQIKVIFAGESNCAPDLSAFPENGSISVHMLGRISHDNVCRLLSEATLLLNLGNKNASLTPSKIFEYMSFGKPIISTFCVDNDTSAAYLRKYPRALLLDERDPDLDGAAVRLKRFILDNRDTLIPYKEVERIFYGNTPLSTIKVLKELEENAEKGRKPDAAFERKN